MKVKDVMTLKVKTLSPLLNTKDALKILDELKISGLPVVDDNGKLLGMFTEKEILLKILPTYMESVGSFVYDENPNSVKKKVVFLVGLKVQDVMRTEVVTVTEATNLCEVAHLMLTKKARRVPVVDAAGHLVGIIARNDVVKALFKEYA